MQLSRSTTHHRTRRLTMMRFVEAFADRGHAGLVTGRLALVTALQIVENLTDRQAAEAVRDKISWRSRWVWG